MAAIASVISAVGNLAPSMEFTIAAVFAVVVLRVEIGRRLANMPQQSVGQSSASPSEYCKRLVGYAPETIGLLGCLGLAGVLRMRGSLDLASLSDASDHNAANMAAMEKIAQEWPILLGADTLLSLQAMLRVCVLASSVLRSGGGPSLLTQESATIACGAALGRVVLAARSNVYMLDGPLGGNLPVAFELMSLVLLLILCRGIHLRTMMTSALTLGAAGWIASRNCLNLADDPLLDGLFMFATIAELLAAFSYLSRAVLSDFEANGSSKDNVAVRFAHIIMPVQACLSAYYFVQAFEHHASLIGAGHPFEVLQWGCTAQVGAYAGAALLHWAESVEEGSMNDIPVNAALTADL